MYLFLKLKLSHLFVKRYVHIATETIQAKAKTKIKMWYEIVVASEAERARAESFIPLLYGTFEQRNISKNIDFFDLAYGTRNVSFYRNNHYP